MRKFFIFIFLPVIIMCSVSKDDCRTDYTSLNQPYIHTNIEIDMISKLNEYRINHGESELQTVNYLSITSENHIDVLVGTNNINHNGFRYRADQIEKYTCEPLVGEILAYNYNTNESALSAWDLSPEHKEIILNPNYNSVGVCIRQDPLNGRYYYMALFAKI